MIGGGRMPVIRDVYCIYNSRASIVSALADTRYEIMPGDVAVLDEYT